MTRAVRNGRIRARLGIDFPLLQAGMGGVAGPELAAAVSNAGCGGVLGLYKCPAQRIGGLLEATRALTVHPFGVNFVPEVASVAVLTGQVDAVLASSGPELFFTFFGLPERSVAVRVREAGRALIVQVGSLEEAEVALSLGADMLVVQGQESGGHHLGAQDLEALLGEVRGAHPEAVLLAAGGIATGGELGRLELSGADGWMCGTLFVATSESRAHPAYKARVVAGEPGDTVVTRLFEIGWPGRAHRVLRNRVVDEGRNLPGAFIGRAELYGGSYLVPRFGAAVPTVDTRGAVEEMALYCGTSCRGVCAGQGVAGVVARLRREYEEFMADDTSADVTDPGVATVREAR